MEPYLCEVQASVLLSDVDHYRIVDDCFYVVIPVSMLQVAVCAMFHLSMHLVCALERERSTHGFYCISVR